jgi:hypothetical protein
MKSMYVISYEGLALDMYQNKAPDKRAAMIQFSKTGPPLGSKKKL